jgi:NADH-quinone oxidoreductase subunit E
MKTEKTTDARWEGILEKYGLHHPPVGPDLERSMENLIPVLQDVQDAYGYLPADVLALISRRTGIPMARMFGVITFYSQFHLKPRGRHTVRCCQGTACHVKGSRSVGDAIAENLGVEEGGTTSDGRFTYETVQCLGTCFLAPVVMVNEDYHGNLARESVGRILKGYK